MTRRRFVEMAGVLPLAGWLSRCTDEGPEPSTLPPRVVALRTEGGNFRFDPAGLRIQSGETLRWLNMGDFHTTTAFHPTYSDMVEGELPKRIPEGASPWHSGMLGLEETQFERRFELPGVYDYFCQPHYQFGMVGRLVVDEAGGGPGTRPLDGVPPEVREQMPTIERIMGPGGRPFEWASRLNGIFHLLANDAPGSDVDDASVAVRAGIGADGDLEGHLGPERMERVLSAVDAVVEGVATGLGYEELVVRADTAKELLV